jgi:hypothetical protein
MTIIKYKLNNQLSHQIWDKLYGQILLHNDSPVDYEMLTELQIKIYNQLDNPLRMQIKNNLI